MYKILVRYYYIEYSDEAHPGLSSAKNRIVLSRCVEIITRMRKKYLVREIEEKKAL